MLPASGAGAVGTGGTSSAGTRRVGVATGVTRTAGTGGVAATRLWRLLRPGLAGGQVGVGTPALRRPAVSPPDDESLAVDVAASGAPVVYFSSGASEPCFLFHPFECGCPSARP